MSLSIGIIGMPNAGKSTLFNALLKRQIAQVGEYPYTTIEPNVGVVEVPDSRLALIADRLSIEKRVPAAIKFIDIAGLIRGAHKGEGLGNQFLGHIREVDAILHVVRAFDPSTSHSTQRVSGRSDSDESPDSKNSMSSGQVIPHVMGGIDPGRDVEIVNEELKLANIEKPTVYVLNVSESDLKKDFDIGREYIKISARLESELWDLSEKEQKEYLEELGVSKPSLEKIIQESYKLLDLITFFTIAGGKQAQAWPLRRGETALAASSLVHSDFEKGFIKAEVVKFQDFLNLGSWQKAADKGKVHIVSRDYPVGDGDIIEFKAKN